MRQPVTAYIALRYFGTKRRNRFASFVSLISIFGIGLGVAVLIIVSSVMNGFEKEITKHVLGMTSHAMLFRPGSTLEDWRTSLEQIESDPDVVAAAPFIRAGAMLNHRGKVRGASIQGIDVVGEKRVSDLIAHLPAETVIALEEQPNSIVLGTSLADALDVKIGQKITVIAPRWNEQRGVELPRYFPLTVSGTFEIGMHDFDSTFALVGLHGASEMFGYGDKISGFRVKFIDKFIAPKRALELAATIDNGMAAVNWTQYHRNFFYALGSQKRIMFVILSIIVAVAAFNIVASMVMIVKEKERDIAILRTLGLNRLNVMLVFVIQGVLIGLGGVILGIATGVIGARKADTVVATIEQLLDIQFIKADVYYINYLPADIRLTDISIIAAVAFAICVSATLYPAWRAASTHPADALRYE